VAWSGAKFEKAGQLNDVEVISTLPCVQLLVGNLILSSVRVAAVSWRHNPNNAICLVRTSC
jgi:hypothetical protein